MGSPDEIYTALRKIGEREVFRVIGRHTVDYDWGREISNSRINLLPKVIVLPETAEQVAQCVKCCTKHGVPFRVRSGGHHHEGMSSLDDGVVIRLSQFNRIERMEGHSNLAWIGVGKPLQEVYDELEKSQQIIPGGGCQTVNVGGLTLGGGWGTSVRKMGLTCDNFEEAELVTAEGKVIRVRADNEYQDLFWALRGGGGGNFGIVTRFLFRIWDLGESVSSFIMQWRPRSQSDLEAVVRGYLETQAKFPAVLTTSMSIRAKHRFMKPKKYFPITLAGKFYGPVDKLRDCMEPFLAEHHPSVATFKEDYVRPMGSLVGFGAETSMQPAHDVQAPRMSDLINSLVDAMHLGAPVSTLRELSGGTGDTDYQNPPPSITCSDPWPHKISSAFPKGSESYAALAKKMVGIVMDTNQRLPKNAARLYMVLHSMPGKKGKIGPKDSAFFWRNKDFIVQFQAWWAKPSLEGAHQGADAFEREQQQYVDWIVEARKRLKPELEGAFVNFVDKNIPVRDYYGGNLERLREIKTKYDPDNVFRFPLSIPPE